jgi:hypothetical protein
MVNNLPLMYSNNNKPEAEDKKNGRLCNMHCSDYTRECRLQKKDFVKLTMSM